MPDPKPSPSPGASFAAMEGEISTNFSKDAPAESATQDCPLKQLVRLRIVVKDDDFAIYRDCPYSLEVATGNFSGTTGPTGVIDHLIPKLTRTAILTVNLDSRSVRWNLDLGPIDPVALETGARDRLWNLELEEHPETSASAAEDPDSLGYAVDNLLAAFGKTPSGKLDAAARELIVKVYSADDNSGEVMKGWRAPSSYEEEKRAMRESIPSSNELPIDPLGMSA